MAKRIALDTNLALLLAVGAASPAYVTRHKRLGRYDLGAFRLLVEVLEHSRAILFSPNIVSETSNLIRYTSEPLRSEVATVFAYLVEGATEEYVPSTMAIRHPAYRSLGVTDAVLLSHSSSETAILTDDTDLYLAAMRARLDVINFTHLRESRP